MFNEQVNWQAKAPELLLDLELGVINGAPGNLQQKRRIMPFEQEKDTTKFVLGNYDLKFNLNRHLNNLNAKTKNFLRRNIFKTILNTKGFSTFILTKILGKQYKKDQARLPSCH